MEENGKQIIKQILLKSFKKIALIALPIITVIALGLVIWMYLLTIDDGTWADGKNSPQSYKNNATITGDGIVIDKNAILEDALKNLGYSDEDIAKIRTDLQNEGYSGEELERKVLEKKLELLNIKDITDLDNINSIELVWELNKELYTKYKIDKYEKLEYLVNAELVTKMPHLDNLSSDKLNGKIYFNRYMNGDTNGTRLTYISENEFNKLLETSDANILKYFTMTQNNEVKIAYYQEESISLETNDTTVDLSTYDSRVTNDNPSFTEAGYQVRIIPYTTMVPERYTLQFEYLWALLVMSEDYDFVRGLADLAYDSEIVISVYDNIIEDTTETEYTYSRQQLDYSQAKIKETEEKEEFSQKEVNNLTEQGYIPTVNVSITNSTTRRDDITEDIRLENANNRENYYIKKIVYTYINSVEVRVTYANVWITEYSTEYKYYTDGHKYGSGIPDSTQTTTQGQKTETEIQDSRLTNQLMREEPGGTRSQKVDVRFIHTASGITSQIPITKMRYTIIRYIGDKWSTVLNSAVSIKEDRYTYSSTYTNNPDSTTVKEKTNVDGELDANGNKIAENFCSLFNNSSKKGYIEDNNEWLIDILESNQETADMVDLTKYLLNKATGKDYYRLDGFNFESIFSTTSIGTLYGGSAEEQLWFALIDAGYSKIAAAGVLGNIYAESGIRADNLENAAETKLGMTDEQYTEAVNNGTYTNFINDSSGYGLAQWTSDGRKQGLYLFAQSKGALINDSSMQIEYLLAEISQSGGANGYATFQMGSAKHGYNYSSWKDSTSIEESAMAFCYVFERPKAGDHSNRVTFAQMYYDRYKDMTGPSASVGDIELTGENKEKMQQMLQDAIRIANDNRYGYSQELRYSEFYYDCSSLVARLYTKHFGISMPSVTGDYHRFNAYNLGNPINVQLMPGDVLWRGQGTEGHVTLYIGNGNYVAAHSAKKPKPEQIDVYQDNPSKYMRVYRFIK